MGKRYTNEDRARDLRDTLLRIRDTTTDPAIFRQADAAAELATIAQWDYNTARSYDADTGGGSGEAWKCRSKAGRAMTKARKLFLAKLTEDQVAAARAPIGTPSIANMLFLRKVAKAAANGIRFRALMVDQPAARPCESERWIEMQSPMIDPYWTLTDRGAEMLVRFAGLTDEVE